MKICLLAHNIFIMNLIMDILNEIKNNPGGMNHGRFLSFTPPPIIVPEIGKGEENKIEASSKSFEIIGQEIKKKAPNTIILITPHGPMFNDAINITYENSIKGNFGQFGASQISMEIRINKKLSKEISETAKNSNIPVVLSTKNFSVITMYILAWITVPWFLCTLLIVFIWIIP